jgi:hypothetical protein
MAIKRIGILTGGGDVPGLNSVIKSATYRSSENGIEIFGLRRGWESHLNFNDPTSRRLGPLRRPGFLIAPSFPAATRLAVLRDTLYDTVRLAIYRRDVRYHTQKVKGHMAHADPAAWLQVRLS